MLGAAVALFGGLALAHLVLVRPFSVGFDLLKVAEGGSSQVGELVNAEGAVVQNRLANIIGVQFDAEGRPLQSTEVASLEQLQDGSAPTLAQLDVVGRDGNTVSFSLVRAGSGSDQVLISGGAEAQFEGQGLSADQLTIDADQGQLTTEGPTQLTTDSSLINSRDGVTIGRDGSLTLGGSQ